MHITRDNNYWIVTNNVQSRQIKSIKMYSLFSENSTNKDPYSPVTFRDSDLSEYINILYELAIFNVHPHGPVCLFLPTCVTKKLAPHPNSNSDKEYYETVNSNLN